MNEEIERMNKKVIISLNEYLELENIKKCHEENMKVIHGKVIIPPEYLERYEALEHNWNELKKCIKDEIERTENLIKEDCNMIQINNIRKMLNEDRECWLYKMQSLEEGGNNDN